ncbi:MAG: hypothetical protein KGI75_14115 [Rhizobiaceae bacterium]|nr:hypothetical protein [Rhizobiaceae bacterium]
MFDEIPEDDVWQEMDDDGPTPKPGILTLSEDDVRALREFEALVGGDCFDVRDDDGAVYKSDTLMGHLGNIRSILARLGSIRSVSESDVRMIYEFDRYVGGNAFDEWHPNGGRCKSRSLIR